MSRKMFAAVLPLAVLALLTPGCAVSGPPEGASEPVVVDEVADGLRQYRKEKDPQKRIEWLEKLSPTRDPRVGVEVGVALKESLGSGQVTPEGMYLIHFAVKYFDRYETQGDDDAMNAWNWWKNNEADLRCRAAQLPK
jgi:hypothetical protein